MLYNKETKKQTLMRYVGDVSQVADARESVLTSGKSDGVRVIDVKTGSGLSFTVVPSRGMDIAWADYKGKAVSFVSKTGIVSPAYFEKDGLNFLRGFFAGLLTTCGLTYMGAPSVDEGEPLGLHGRASNIPAEDVSVYKEWDGDDYAIKIRGKIREAKVFGENISLTREITTKMGSTSLSVTDTVENCGFNAQPFMHLYHCNFGYPIVSEDTKLYTSPAKVEPRDEEARSGLSAYNVCQKPTHDFSEHVFFLNFAEKHPVACLFNETMQIGAYVKSNTDELGCFGLWKMMGEGDYVVGLEPATWIPLGRAEARKRGELAYIQPGEVKKIHLEIGVVESRDDVAALGLEVK